MHRIAAVFRRRMWQVKLLKEKSFSRFRREPPARFKSEKTSRLLKRMIRPHLMSRVKRWMDNCREFGFLSPVLRLTTSLFSVLRSAWERLDGDCSGNQSGRTRFRLPTKPSQGQE